MRVGDYGVAPYKRSRCGVVTDSCVRVHVWRVVWTAFAIFSFFKLMEQFLIKRGVVRRCVWCGVSSDGSIAIDVSDAVVCVCGGPRFRMDWMHVAMKW